MQQAVLRLCFIIVHIHVATNRTFLQHLCIPQDSSILF